MTLPRLTQQALDNGANARQLYRVARATSINARRQGESEIADRWNDIASRWLKAYQYYYRAHEYYLPAELTGDAEEAGKKGRLGALAYRAAEMLGRSADALEQAEAEQTQARSARENGNADEAEAHERSAEALRELAEAWKKAGEAYFEAKSRFLLAYPPPDLGSVMGPDPDQIEAAECLARQAARLEMAARAHLAAEQARRAAEEARQEGDSEGAERLERAEEKWNAAAETWERAAVEEKSEKGTKRSAAQLDEAAGALEHAATSLELAAAARDSEEVDGLASAAERWEQAAQEFANAADAVRGGDLVGIQYHIQLGETLHSAADGWRSCASAHSMGLSQASILHGKAAETWFSAADRLRSARRDEAERLHLVAALWNHAAVARRFTDPASIELAETLEGRARNLDTNRRATG